MNRAFLLTLAAALIVSPLALAHPPIGQPKTYCEPKSDWGTHDYGPAGTRHLLVGFTDGVTGNCHGTWTINPGYPCAGFDDPADPLTFYAGVCEPLIVPPVADYDGHSEYALGGAFLLAESGTGFYDPAGSGSLYCYGEPGHHPAFPEVFVEDLTLGTIATYIVGADYGPSRGLPEGAYVEGPRKQIGSLTVTAEDGSCGDGLVDLWQTCEPVWWSPGPCSVGFPPGLDGAYYVFVEGTQGHVTTSLVS